MRTRFWKLSALVLALMIALSGCSLIEIDQEMDMAEVVATVGDTKITKGEVIDEYNYEVMYTAYMYDMYGLELTNDQIEEIKDSVLETYIEQELLLQKAKELNLTDFSDESFAETDAEAAEYYETMITEHAEHVDTEGMTDEQAREAVIAHLNEEGNTIELVTEYYRDAHVANLVRDYVIEGIEVTEEEIQAAYTDKVAADEAQYKDSKYLYETHNTYGYTIAWNPEGYRTVKHILFLLSDEQNDALSELDAQLTEVEAAIAALTTAADAEATAEPEATADPEAAPVKTLDELTTEKETIETQIAEKKAEILASFEEKTTDVYTRLEAGESFDALMAELGEDPGMKEEPNMSTGYFVCADSTTWDIDFRDAAMAIEEVGGVSEPVLGASGIHIIYYNSDVTPGAVAIEDVRDELAEQMLTTKQDEAFTAQYEEWKAGTKIKKYPKVLG